MNQQLFDFYFPNLEKGCYSLQRQTLSYTNHFKEVPGIKEPIIIGVSEDFMVHYINPLVIKNIQVGNEEWVLTVTEGVTFEIVTLIYLIDKKLKP